MVGSDHFHQLWLDNMPQFLVGKAPFFDANWYNEEREFGLPRMRLAGDEDAVRAPPARRASTPTSTWPSATSCGSTTASPARSSRCGREADLPIVPVYTNIFAPPLPQPARFVAAGPGDPARWSSRGRADQRVAIIGTGHLSLELGGPRQFGEHGPDPEFDRRAVEWIANGDLDGCLAEVTLDSLHAPGNATHGFMDFMLMMGVAGDGAKADHVDSLDLFHTMEAYFTWYPEGALS